MSIVLNDNVVANEQGTALLITDTTGIYNVSNTGGYGTPNPATSAFTTDECTITIPNGNTFLATGSAFTITLYPTFPTEDETLEITISADQLGQSAGDLLATGVYKFERVATASSVDYSYTNYYLVYPKVKQAVWQLTLSSYTVNPAYIEMNDMLSLIELAWSYGEQNKAIYTLQKLINLLIKYGKTNL